MSYSFSTVYFSQENAGDIDLLDKLGGEGFIDHLTAAGHDLEGYGETQREPWGFGDVEIYREETDARGSYMVIHKSPSDIYVSVTRVTPDWEIAV
jgi:hypothetical protein